MNFKDIKQLSCSGGKAVGINPYDKPSESDYYKRKSEGVSWGDFLYKQWNEFEKDKVTFACSPELNGVYGAEQLELVWQYEIENEPGFWFTSRDQSHFKNGFKEWADYMLSIGCVNTRQFLQLKDQPMSELPIPKMETTELPSPDSTSTPQGTFIINDDVTIEVLKTGIWFNDFLLDKNEAIKLSKLIQTAFLNNHER